MPQVRVLPLKVYVKDNCLHIYFEYYIDNVFQNVHDLTINLSNVDTQMTTQQAIDTIVKIVKGIISDEFKAKQQSQRTDIQTIVSTLAGGQLNYEL